MFEGEGDSVLAGTGASDLIAALEPFLGRRFSLADGQRGAWLVQLRQAIDLLEVEFSGTASAFARTDVYEMEGSVSAFDWIRHNCKVSGHIAYDRLRVGDQLGSLGQSAQAAAAGEIGFGHLALMAGVAKALHDATATPFNEKPLLARAVDQSVSRFRYTCERAGTPVTRRDSRSSRRGESRRASWSCWPSRMDSSVCTACSTRSAPECCGPRSSHSPSAAVATTVGGGSGAWPTP